MGRVATRLILVAALASVGFQAASEDALAFEWTGSFARYISAYRITAAIASSETVHPDLHPYDLVVPMFSDYAEKRRFVYLPDDTAITYHSDAAFDVPVGAVLVKTFLYPTSDGEHLVETRLMFHTDTGWKGAAYVWDDAHADARLKVAGAQVPVTWTDTTGAEQRHDYLIPDMNQCKMCHRETGAMAPIGLKARHLNLDRAYAEGSENQIARWSRLGILEGAPRESENLPRAADASATVTRQAATYFDINCAHCHNPAGLASHTRLDLRPVQSNPHARGILKPPTTAGNASRGRLFAVVPGDPDASFLLHRIESTRPDVRMPPVSRTQTDREGAALIRAWIGSLDAEAAAHSN